MSDFYIPNPIQLSAAMEELDRLLQHLHRNNQIIRTFPPSSVQTRRAAAAGGSQRVPRRKRVRGVRRSDIITIPDERSRLMTLAVENCSDQTALTWLRENSESSTFSKLADMFNFLKTHIAAEEKKNHGDAVDVVFMAHGAIRDFMIPASCLLPLASIRDVVLYAPWNCVTCSLGYGIATGRLQPQHRVFYCTKKLGCTVPDEKHRPVKLPDRWNSMRQAGDQMIPNITVSPLRPDDGIWKNFESLTKKHGSVGRNRIVVPFIFPGKESDSVPFSVVTLALSLVLLQSRFKATVHLDACLGDQSIGQKLDKSYLEQQYACAIDGTGLACSPEMFSRVQLNIPEV